MNEKFSYDEYIKLLRTSKNEFDQTAYNYCHKYIPNTVFKYMSIDVPSGKESGKKREQKITALRNEKVWASHANILNDPFELKVFKYDLTNSYVRTFHEEVMKAYEIISLSGTPLDKLMWSHYSNGHAGICLEFEVEDKGTIFPVEYYDTNDREDMTLKIET